MSSRTSCLCVCAAMMLAAGSTATAQSTVRFATFNVSLNRAGPGILEANLATTDNAQARVIAENIQRINPDVILLNEFDYDENGNSGRLFQDNYLSVSQNGANPVSYPYRYFAPSNTGVFTGFDLDNNGTVGLGNDAQGFGFFEGQFGMMLYSKHPIQTNNIRTFQNFLWKDMPGNRLPDDPATPQAQDWYSPEEQNILRLSSKSHWDVPITVNGQTVHLLAAHPTPPVFDGAEDRNGTRNADEIRLFADYITPGASDYIYDDNGQTGGLAADQKFVILGDYNSDPLDGDSIPGAMQQLLNNPRVNTSITPDSEGGLDAAIRQSGANDSHLSDPRFDTADFADGAPGNLRADYVLPSSDMTMVDAGVFWPVEGDPLFPIVGNFPFPGTDHRLVWADVIVPAPGAPALALVAVVVVGRRRR